MCWNKHVRNIQQHNLLNCFNALQQIWFIYSSNNIYLADYPSKKKKTQYLYFQWYVKINDNLMIFDVPIVMIQF